MVLEELGYSLFPGPVLTTALLGAIVARYGNDARRGLSPGFGRRQRTGRLALGAGTLSGDAHGRVSGTLRPVLGAPTAGLILAPLSNGTWCLVEPGEHVTVENLVALDATRPLGEVTVSDLALAEVAHLGDLTEDNVRDLALVLVAAESAGLARWCLETASEYAKVRVQFGRPIGPAIKHALADMLVGVEQTAAVAWDAAAAWGSPAVERSEGHDDDLAKAGERSLSARVAER